MSATDPIREVRESQIRLEGKLDAYAAGQSAALAEHGRRLDEHDKALAAERAERIRADDEIRDVQSPRRTSPWAIVAAVGGLLMVLLGTITLTITLIDKIAN